MTETLWHLSRMQSIEARYRDLIEPESMDQHEETRTAEEIIEHIKKGLGGGEPTWT